MAEKEFAGVLPHLLIRDGRAAEAASFYAAAFGAVEEMRHLADDGVRLLHVRLSINDGILMLNDDFPEYAGGTAAGPPAGVVLHIQVVDADAAWARALAAGATVRFPLADQFWGDRYGQVIDPFGHVWSIGATAA